MTRDPVLADLCRRVIEAADMDNYGVMVGGQWVGGNGGLWSQESIKVVEELRRHLARMQP